LVHAVHVTTANTRLVTKTDRLDTFGYMAVPPLNLNSRQARKLDSGWVTGMPRNAVLITPLLPHAPSIRRAFADPSGLSTFARKLSERDWYVSCRFRDETLHNIRNSARLGIVLNLRLSVDSIPSALVDLVSHGCERLALAGNSVLRSGEATLLAGFGYSVIISGTFARVG
jgi:hypothetical protein